MEGQVNITVIRFANSSVKTVLMEKFLQTKSILIDFNYLDLKMARKNVKRPKKFWRPEQRLHFKIIKFW